MLSTSSFNALLKTLEALNWHSGLIFITVALGAALIPVVVFAFAVAFFSRDRS